MKDMFLIRVYDYDDRNIDTPVLNVSIYKKKEVSESPKYISSSTFM